MDVSVILVSYNTKDLTIDCLKSIYQYTKDIDFEVFVVDNNSHDGSADMIAEEFPQVKLIRNPDNKGFGAANNIAIRESRAQYVFLLNTDTLLIENSVKNFFDFMEKEENQIVGACGGIMLDKNNNQTYLEFKFPSIFNDIFRQTSVQNLSHTKEVDWMGGANLFLRKSVLDKVGLFDEKFFMYYEETDLCRRIKNCGYKIYFVPYSTIIHLEGASFDKSKKINMNKAIIFAKSKCYYYKKYNGVLGVFAVKTCYIFWHLYKFIISRDRDELRVLINKLGVKV